MNSDQVRKSPRLQQKEKEKPKPSPMGKGSKTATVGSDDVEMKPALSAQEEQQNLVLLEIKQNVLLIEKSVRLLEKRFAVRAWRATASLRKLLSVDVLLKAAETHLASNSSVLASLQKYLGKASGAMEVEVDSGAMLPEVEVYLGLLCLIHLIDSKQIDKALALASELVTIAQKANRRTLDPLAASVYFYFAYIHEVKGTLDTIRGTLLAAQRSATLRHDDESQATLLNLLLRSYLNYNLYDQADKLMSKSTFPDVASNNQLARYMYYTGRVKAIQLEYTEAHRRLLQAIRKAPQSNASAGFQQSVNKLFVIVQLLMGEIPERSLFRSPVLAKPLIPYFHITQSVRTGDLAMFQDTISKFANQFKKDKTLTLILRLRQNVIKTGVKMISLSYSKISLKDICLKLHLDSEEDAEFIVAKAIRDGVIDAVIVHEAGYVKTKEIADVYSTGEPQDAYNQRISFCLQLHNDSVKALRFPSKPEQNNPDGDLNNDLRELENEIAELEEFDF